MTEAEQLDQQKLAADVLAAKLAMYDQCAMFDRMDAGELKACGHASRDAALLYTVRRTMERIEKLRKDFVRKWPD